MKNLDYGPFIVSQTLDVVIDDDGPHDVTGILCLRSIGRDNQPLQSISIAPSDIPELIKVLVKAAMTLEQKGLTVAMYSAGYRDAEAGKPSEIQLDHLNL